MPHILLAAMIALSATVPVMACPATHYPCGSGSCCSK